MSDDPKALKRKNRKQSSKGNGGAKCQKNDDGHGEINSGSNTEYPATEAKAQSFDTEELTSENARSGVIREEPPQDSFEVEENMENLIQKKKYADALHRGRKSKRSLRVRLLSAECYLRMGLADDMDKIKECVNIVSKLTGDSLDDLGGVYQKMRPKQIGKSLIMYASASFSYAKANDLKPDDAVFNGSYSIYLFSDAVRRNIMPSSDSKAPKEARLLDEKRFGDWGKSIPILIGLMETMLEAFRNISGANSRSKYKSEAFALNWIASTCLHFHKFTKAIEYCELGLEIMDDERKCGKCFSEVQTYGDLLHNIGVATGVNDAEKGEAYLEKSLRMKEQTKFKNDNDKTKSTDATKSQLARLRLRS